MQSMTTPCLEKERGHCYLIADISFSFLSDKLQVKGLQVNVSPQGLPKGTASPRGSFRQAGVPLR